MYIYMYFLYIFYVFCLESSSFLIPLCFNPLIPGGNKKVTCA